MLLNAPEPNRIVLALRMRHIVAFARMHRLGRGTVYGRVLTKVLSWAGADWIFVWGSSCGPGAESLSFGKPEKYEECAVEPDEICIGETPEMVAHVRPRHRRDLVDHDLAWLLDPGGRRHPYSDPGQRCVEEIGCQRTDRDRGGCIEPIVLNDDDGSRLAGIDASCSSDADVASPHSAVQSTEMASTKAWSSASCSLAAMAADWRWASATNSGARTSGTHI